MSPNAIAALGLFALEEAIKLEPAIYGAVQALFAKGNPTPEDWAALRAQVGGKTYADYVPASAIPAGQ